MDAGAIMILVAVGLTTLVSIGWFFFAPRAMDAPDAELLKKLFSAAAYDPETQLFMILPDAIGFGVVMSPMPGADAGLKDKLNTLLTLNYPENTLVQCTLWKSPDIEEMLSSYTQLRRGAKDALSREITAKRVDFLRTGTHTPVDRTSGITLHDSRIILTVRVPVGLSMPTSEQVKRVSELQKAFMQTMKSAGLHGEPLVDESYLRILQTMFNHGPEASWRERTDTQVEPSQLLQHQILDADVAPRITADAVYFGDTMQARTLSIKRNPEYTYFGMAMKYLADFTSGARGIRQNCLITLNLIYPDQEKARKEVELQQLWATKQSEGLITRYSPRYRQRKESLDMVVKSIGEGDAIVQGYLGMAVFAPNDDEAIAAVNNARTYWRELGFQLMSDRYFVFPLLMQLIPFAADVAIKASLQRYRTMATRNAVSIMPVLGSWRGTQTPHMTLIARDGQLMSWSPFDSDTNYGCVVAASSGAGKSFAVNELVLSILATQGRAWIIDVGNSYEKLCEQLGGQYLRFERHSAICLNPFPLVQNYDEEADMLAAIIAIMAAPKDGLNDYQNARLKEVMSETYARKRQETSIDDIADGLLADADTRVRDIGQQLFSFTSKGEYGRYFNGPNTFQQSNQFIVIELGELKGQPHLQRVILFQVMYQINQAMYGGDPKQRKMMICDEAWDLMASEQTKNFLVTMYRRARKANGSPVTITQSVSDYYTNPGAMAMVENSANMLLLKQKGESINAVQKENRLPFGEWGYTQLRTVHTVPGSYSEIMLVTDRGTGVGRLVVSDFQKLLYTTKPDELALIAHHKKRGLSTVEAINTIVTDRLPKAA